MPKERKREKQGKADKAPFSSLSPIFVFSSFRPFVILFLLRLNHEMPKGRKREKQDKADEAAFSSLSPIFAFSFFRVFVILFLLRLDSARYLHEKDSFAFQPCRAEPGRVRPSIFDIRFLSLCATACPTAGERSSPTNSLLAAIRPPLDNPQALPPPPEPQHLPRQAVPHQLKLAAKHGHRAKRSERIT